jgi:polysaccharide pyruvyl transferase WcaK-like protein
MTKILLLNSDSPSNKGDQLILKGNILLIKRFWPDAEIWACSQFPERDKKWFGINFLPIPVFSLNPIELTKISLLARECDYVLWGGGEFLKDYTNRVSVIYWFLRILSIWVVNKQIFGIFQGIGPTKSKTSKKLIAATVSLTKYFFLRDQESYQKLIDWGVNESMLRSSFDPALLLINDKDVVIDKYVGEEFTKNVIGVSLRRWFHYEMGQFLPFSWRTRNEKETIELLKYKKNMAELLDLIIDSTGRNILFFPMFNSLSEGDRSFCHEVMSLMNNSSRAFNLDSEKIPPDAFINIASKCDAFLTTRLHASIMAVVAGVPTTNLYYVEKGRLFFEQINQDEFSFPIEFLLDNYAILNLSNAVERSIEISVSIRERNNNAIDIMRAKIFGGFKEVMDTHESKTPD